MRINELEIKNVRGIPYLYLTPKGRNFVIWGPNGTGKSAVIDAIEFLLTGDISRLTGKGTKGITLKKHGPHVDHEPGDAAVRAVIQIAGISEPIEIKRSIDKPNNLEYEISNKSYLEKVIETAQTGQYVLSRREILKYIAAEAKTRATEIQELLNISEIEDVREAFVKARNQASEYVKSCTRLFDEGKKEIGEIIGVPGFNEETLLKYINDNRAVHKGLPLDSPNPDEIKKDIAYVPPTVVNVEEIEKNKNTILKLVGEDKQFDQFEVKLKELIDDMGPEFDVNKETLRVKLTEIGLSLIDDTADCPLCDTFWEPGKLKFYLEKRLTDSKKVIAVKEDIDTQARLLMSNYGSVIFSVSKILDNIGVLEVDKEVEVLGKWFDDLSELRAELTTYSENYSDFLALISKAKNYRQPDRITDILSNVYTAADAKKAQTSPEQTAWDNLTSIERPLRQYENASKELLMARALAEKTEVLTRSYITNRDRVLESLYDEIKDRFVSFYCALHEDEAGNFDADFEPKGAGLAFDVDFYGRGKHPPLALHSEGHQDSMGLCLFLALSERLSKNVIDLIMLDDVVMSVDTEHRRQLCRLLNTELPDRQFLITTHDLAWAKELQHMGVVESDDLIKFYNWDVVSGPTVSFEVDMWSRIDTALEENDLREAAGCLRHGCEHFFALVCDSLQASIRFSISNRWEFGELFTGAISRYKKLIKKAKQAAHVKGDTDKFDVLNELESQFSQIYQRTGAESWMINPSIHYNNWVNFSAPEFKPVVDAFKDLFLLLKCSKCGSVLKLAMLTDSLTPIAVTCDCGSVFWDLKVPKKQ